MQRTIQKVLAELAKDKPDLSYIRGLLEGLVDEMPIPSNAFRMPDNNKVLVDNTHVDEEEIPASVRPGPVAKIS
jgi:hypothetical protein